MLFFLIRANRWSKRHSPSDPGQSVPQQSFPAAAGMAYPAGSRLRGDQCREVLRNTKANSAWSAVHEHGQSRFLAYQVVIDGFLGERIRGLPGDDQNLGCPEWDSPRDSSGQGDAAGWWEVRGRFCRLTRRYWVLAWNVVSYVCFVPWLTFRKLHSSLSYSYRHRILCGQVFDSSFGLLP
jgi:hypothetical protein